MVFPMGISIAPDLDRAYFFTLLYKVPTYAFGHETNRQGHYTRNNKSGNFDVSATRIQWKTSRTTIRPKIRGGQV